MRMQTEITLDNRGAGSKLLLGHFQMKVSVARLFCWKFIPARAGLDAGQAPGEVLTSAERPRLGLGGSRCLFPTAFSRGIK